MIRNFEQNDIEKVMDIWLNTNISAHGFIDKAYWENAYDLVRSLLPSSKIFVYQEENTIKAFIGINDIYIAGLFVCEQCQSRGIGKSLLDYCKERYSRLELDVFIENESAVRFYQKNGFTVTEVKMNTEFNHEEYRMAWTS